MAISHGMISLTLAAPIPSPNKKPHSSNSNSVRVAFQGSPGAYSEFAAKTAIPSCSTLPCRSFSDAISSLSLNLADHAILPVESTMEGTALRNYDLLLRHPLFITQEINLFVHYCLLAIPGVLPTHLKTVISHPMALAHCDRSLTRLGLHPQPVEDTAGAVEMLLDNRLLDTAAIASPRAAKLYGLNVLAHGLQDESWNVTRFLILSKHPNNNITTINADSIATEQIVESKTSVVIAHRGGCMHVILKVLKAFSSRNLNLTKLEVINHEQEEGEGEGKSPVMILDVRPDGKKGSLRAFPHVLYVDFEGSMEDFRVREAIDEIAKFSVFVRILGTYSADPNVYDFHYY
ncbi:putative arogenate dehydratase [Dioscorea sansibarensis]